LQTEADPSVTERQAHFSEEWMPCAIMAIRLVSSHTFEANCEHDLSTERHVVDANGTNDDPLCLPARLSPDEYLDPQLRRKAILK
jgi:hypothetical protein